jgi:hypothetical protein
LVPGSPRGNGGPMGCSGGDNSEGVCQVRTAEGMDERKGGRRERQAIEELESRMLMITMPEAEEGVAARGLRAAWQGWDVGVVAAFAWAWWHCPRPQRGTPHQRNEST